MLIREETNVDRGLTSDRAESCLVITRYWCPAPTRPPRRLAVANAPAGWLLQPLPSCPILDELGFRFNSVEDLQILTLFALLRHDDRFERFNEEKGIARAKSALIQGSVYQCFLTAVRVSKPFKKCQKALISY